MKSVPSFSRFVITAVKTLFLLTLFLSVEVHAARAKLAVMRQLIISGNQQHRTSLRGKSKSRGGGNDESAKNCISLNAIKSGKSQQDVAKYQTDVEKAKEADIDNPYKVLKIWHRCKKETCLSFQISRAAVKQKILHRGDQTLGRQIDAARNTLEDARTKIAYDTGGPEALKGLQAGTLVVPDKDLLRAKVHEEIRGMKETDPLEDEGSLLEIDAVVREPCTIAVVLTIIGLCMSVASAAKGAVDVMKLPDMHKVTNAFEKVNNVLEVIERQLRQFDKDVEGKLSSSKTQQLKREAGLIKGMINKLKWQVLDVQDDCERGDPNNRERLNSKEDSWHRFDWKSIVTLGIGNIVVACNINANDQISLDRALSKVGSMEAKLAAIQAAITGLLHQFTHGLLTSYDSGKE